MCETSVKDRQLLRAEQPRPGRPHRPPGTSAVCSEPGGTIAEFTRRPEGDKMTVAVPAHGDRTSCAEACSPAQSRPDQRTKLRKVLLMAARSRVSTDYPEDGD